MSVLQEHPMNECWSADFMSDALWCSRRFRTFNVVDVVDDFNREVLAIELEVTQVSYALKVQSTAMMANGYPKTLVCPLTRYLKRSSRQLIGPIAPSNLLFQFGKVYSINSKWVDRRVC
jgi:hypothetical protein